MRFPFPLALLALVNIAVSGSTGDKDNFTLVGFAQDNPIGETTGGGGKGSPTTTIKNAAALATAVLVSLSSFSQGRLRS